MPADEDPLHLAPTGPETGVSEEAVPVVPVDTIPADPVRSHLLADRQETARLALAIFFAVLFVVTVLLSYGSLVWGTHWAATKEWLQILLPAETALLGSAVGFYFGTRR